MNCAGCNTICKPRARLLNCHACEGIYHIECLNIKQQQYSSLTEEFKAAWICLSCNNVTRRGRSNLLKPVRSTQIPLDDNMNMSYEIEGQTPISSYNPCTPTTPATSVHECVALETGATFHDTGTT
ncbi:unnamed protein product [Parnassius apollo]|uniref:(apollo) hypothetical protein n=1 Tax=Parnassius apollo TaxID=110799 RepID=A0A8S3WW58_PARAO|nr:unnamed protein product [Parnassius apollo]